MPIHWFEHSELVSIIDGDRLVACCDDDGDHVADIDVLDQLRQDAESYVKGRVGVRYDPTQWDVDADADDISDNLPGDLKGITKEIDVYYILRRRGQVDEIFQRMYDIAEMKLERIAAGTMPLGSGAVSNRTISGNMGESDIGELTMNDGQDPLTYSEML